MSLQQYIEELSSQNTDYKFPEQAINQAESLKSLSSDLYTDNIRFIYELIQNADDAQAKNVILTILEDQYLIITHDGRKRFDEKDLQGLCGINNGTKKKDLDKTGYKGLGFKAVFGKSDCVIIYSNGEYFRFDASYKIKWNKEWKTANQELWEKENDRQFIYPWQINPIWTTTQQIPKLILNFINSKQKQIHVAYAILLNNHGEIYSAIQQLKQQPYMFLFLRNISLLTFLTDPTDIISVARDVSHGLKKVYINKNIDSQWIIKRFELDIPDDILEKLAEDTKAPDKLRFIKTKVEMFFATKYKDASGIEKLREQESILFSYLPTKISEYKFPVLINANFLTNVNREQIHTDSVWNQWLFAKIADQIFQWIKELVKDNKFRFQAYRLIPWKLNLIDNPLSKQFNDSFAIAIKQCNFILNRKNQLLKVDEVIMDSTSMSKQRRFINIDAMRQYIIDNNKSSSQYAEHPFIEYDSNLYEIGVKEFHWDNCIDMFKSDIFLKNYSIENNKQMIVYFYTEYSKNDTNNSIKMKIKEIPFLMDQNERLQSIKDIYFPTETIGDSGTVDSEDLFVHKTVFNWLNEKTQKEIKQWLKDIGVEERTDLVYLHKTIIPNATTYITMENTMKTIKMLFILFQKKVITKKELDQLKKLKLLTIRGTLVAAEQCFFSDQYKPRSSLEDYLKTKEDKFLSYDYVSSHPCKNEDLTEWREFFSTLGVQEELHPIVYHRALTSYEAASRGFCEEYLSNVSPDGKHSVDAFSELTTITFIQHTKNNYEFANFFWSYVVKYISPEILTQKIRVYWGHADKRGATDGTLLEDSDYVKWFVKNIKCIPTTEKTCELSSNVFSDQKELKDLCSKYMSFSSILIPQNKTQWNEIFNFKTKLSINDYFDLIEKIRYDEKNLKDNLERIQLLYSHILKEMYYWSGDKRNTAKERTKSSYLLTENIQWKLSSDLYFYMEDNRANNALNDAIPCLKLDFKNRNDLHLHDFLELFNIKQIRMNDLNLADEKSSPAEYFRHKLIEISPFLKKWLKYEGVSTDVICLIDRKLQQEYDLTESDNLQLFYHKIFVRETTVYFDNKRKQLYVKRPWDSETTFIDLPNKLCQLLNIQGFEKNIRFLLKGTIDEIKKHFNSNSIEIPTEKDIVILKLLLKTDVLQQPKFSLTSESKPNTSLLPVKNVKSTETSITNNNDHLLVLTPSCQVVPQHYQIPFYDAIPALPVQLLIQNMRPRKENEERLSTSVFIGSSENSVDDIEFIDICSITDSSLMSFANLSHITGECDASDLDTGRIGEEMVYKYLLKEHREQSNSVIIKWLNQNRETHLPYDILLKKNGKTYYIEVKSTRAYNQHIFPLSINQIETLLQQRENYFIYRVYIDEKKIIILDNIRWRLMQKQQLVCLLQILTVPSE
ncbi:unnamed protein product [Adineta steineri]|uniref:Protein NO VEIN C-terminal domain-containing protein n=1 Tax=Adineta steineri TaxID=433720 RepID=A0A814F680_9BILA|nr:unnamed protein product [Adineta steineri]CAF3793000.1 unnamed protein product [Adineta steineri]